MTKKTNSIPHTAGKVLVATAVAGAGIACGAGSAQAADGSTWGALAQCESGGNWGANTGNGFSGGLQFTPSTWKAYGGQGSPTQASREQQIAVAERVLAGQGWGAWPACSRKLGLSGKQGATAQAPAKQQPSQAAQSKPQPQPHAVTPQTQEAPKNGAQPSSAQQYTVKAGDTLSGIASELKVQGGWAKLAEVNADGVSDPNLIYSGQVLKLPA